MVGNSHSTRNGLICVLLFAVCYLVAWPFAETGFIDDWSYIKSAQVFAQSGHLVYNGWGAPMLGWQALWGALFIRLFGFSFTVVKLSTLPLAMTTIFLFHSILVRLGCTTRNGVIGALTLGLSPLFLPLTASFMTDVYGLFVIEICLYCCLRAMAAPTSKGSIVWLCVAALSNVAGGTVRQIVWLGALVMVPCAAWCLRKRKGVLWSLPLLLIVSVSVIFCCSKWLARQPYTVPMSIAIRPPIGNNLARGLYGFVVYICCLSLVMFPVILPWLRRIPKLTTVSITEIIALLLPWTVLQFLFGWTLPWIQNILVAEFEAKRNAASFDFMLSKPWCLIWSALIVTTVFILLKEARDEFRAPDGKLKLAFVLFAPFSLCYLCVLFSLASQSLFFDRYLLVLLPMAIAFTILLYQQKVSPNLPTISTVTLAVYAILAVAGTHDWFAWQRALLAAIEEVRSSGVPRNEIQGGLEYDGWTQIGDGGHVNNDGIKVPPSAYDPNPKVPKVAADCQLQTASNMPAVQPLYTVAFNPKPCLLPSRYPPVQYRTWLPPFHGTVYVQKIPQG